MKRAYDYLRSKTCPVCKMTDIVERLRDQSIDDTRVLDDAANEIERLRESVTLLRNTLDLQDGKIERWHKALTTIAKGDEWEMAQEIARSALAEDPKGDHSNATQDHAR